MRYRIETSKSILWILALVTAVVLGPLNSVAAIAETSNLGQLAARAGNRSLWNSLPPKTRALLKTQAPLVQAAKEIRRKVTDFGDGYGGVGIDVDSNSVLLRWKGAVPQPVRAMASRLKVKVVRSSHSLQELRIYKVKIAKMADVSTVTASADGSRIEVHVKRGISNARKTRC